MTYTIQWSVSYDGKKVDRIGLFPCGDQCCKSEPNDLNYAYLRLAHLTTTHPKRQGKVIEV